MYIYYNTLLIYPKQQKETKTTYEIHVLFAEKFQVVLYMEATSMSILFAAVSSVARMVSGQNIVKLKMV